MYILRSWCRSCSLQPSLPYLSVQSHEGSVPKRYQMVKLNKTIIASLIAITSIDWETTVTNVRPLEWEKAQKMIIKVYFIEKIRRYHIFLKTSAKLRPEVYLPLKFTSTIIFSSSDTKAYVAPSHPGDSNPRTVAPIAQENSWRHQVVNLVINSSCLQSSFYPGQTSLPSCIWIRYIALHSQHRTSYQAWAGYS